jgi:Mrp family chromosome partitioning ATPase
MLLTDLRGSYDFIVVDAPAIGVVYDYLLIMKHIDVHLFVVRRKVSKKSFIRDVEKWKRKGKVENLYLVLNDVVGRAFKYGQSYRYGESQKKNSVEKYFTS